MAEVAMIVNLVNKFAMAFSFEENESSVQQLLALFTEDGSFTHELVGMMEGKSNIEIGFREIADLKFLADTRYLPSGHVVKYVDASHANVVSYTVISWKCSAVSVIQWMDEVVKENGEWLFQSRKAEALQKNLELIGEMQLRGKKQYAHHNDESED